MNRKMILFVMLKMVQLEGALLLFPTLVSYLYKEESGHVFLLCALTMILLSTLLTIKKPKNQVIFAKEGVVVVALAWVVWSAFGALPFYITGAIPNYMNAFFETVSGFTTTGATILAEVESLPKGILFWRNFTHWIGGMGVLVLTMSVLPLAKDRSMHFMRAEATGPTVGKLVPKMQSTAKILYGMYFVLTAILVVLLLLGGMPLFDSIVHSFSTAGTGGFTIKNNSIAYYDSPYIEGVLSVFMILFGVNFSLFYFVLIKNIRGIYENEELKVYLGMIGVSIGIVTISIASQYNNIGEGFRYASFQVASIISTTGFVTADYELWPTLVQVIFLLLMLIGSCGGSTSGGIKVARVIVAFKSIKMELKQMLHPRSIIVVKLDGKKVKEETRNDIAFYLMVFTVVLCVSTIFISINNLDFATSFTAVLACLSNAGSGLAGVGPTENFNLFSDFSKLVLCVNMLLGRLNIFPMLLLFTPSVWKKEY